MHFQTRHSLKLHRLDDRKSFFVVTFKVIFIYYYAACFSQTTHLMVSWKLLVLSGDSKNDKNGNYLNHLKVSNWN